ncbi:Transcription initiation factor IIF subunit beta [Escovopsis weberi]|uniref:Transcription initiation factor IIF subunit beta n=1 Tax=Escovopsis weberi TaxID=150374 RepID=A0A0M9VVJ8_ESCWE|nr:Transcription initiation factor IIF subunit beta [Escovopsis weberi]
MADNQMIKTEPSDSPVPMDEDEILEDDAGDLDFYDKSIAGNAYEMLYLARIPRYMWDAWMKMTERLGDDEEIQIGTLRTWNEPQMDSAMADGSAREVTKLRMLLTPNCPEHQLLPREYDLEVLDQDVHNHYIFSEEDLPGFKAKNKARAEAASAGIPLSLLRSKNNNGNNNGNNGGNSGEKPSFNRRQRYQPYYRKAIPKKSKIFGKVRYDIRVEPHNLQEEEELLAKRIFDAENSKTKLQIISRNKASAIINPGSVGAVNWGGSFIKNAPPALKAKKGEVLKAARIPKNQLLDLIFDCFRQYQYWSMKALRQRTQQPDSYLRQVLEEVAVLNKSGPFANHYCLSAAYRDKGGNDAKEEAAEAADDDDDEEEMEDVLLSL